MTPLIASKVGPMALLSNMCKYVPQFISSIKSALYISSDYEGMVTNNSPLGDTDWSKNSKTTLLNPSIRKFTGELFIIIQPNCSSVLSRLTHVKLGTTRVHKTILLL